MQSKVGKVLVVLGLAAGLFGCGKERENVSFVELLKDPSALQEEQNWCGQQQSPWLIKGCRSAGNAAAFLRQPELAKHPESLAKAIDLLDRPEPWPNRSHDFFVAARRSELAQLELDSGHVNFVRSKEQQIAYLKTVVAAVSQDQRHAQMEEANWCAGQFLKRDMSKGKNRFSEISSACEAVSAIRAQDLLIELH